MGNPATQRAPERKESAAPSKTVEVNTGSSIRRALDFFPGWLRSRIAPTFGAAIVALLGFWFTPLKDIGLHKIWRESATLEMQPNTETVHEGDEFTITLVVTPERIDLSAGTIFVDFSSDTLQLQGPGNVISMPGAKESTVVSTLKFRALKHGPAHAHISLKTKYGSYEANRIFFIYDLTDQAIPTKFNLSGKWNFRLNQSTGELHLIDNAGAISGTYELDSGDIGSLRGVRGPAAFQVSLLSNKSHEKYSVQCIVNLQDDFLELKGDAKPVDGLHAANISFYASSRT